MKKDISNKEKIFSFLSLLSLCFFYVLFFLNGKFPLHDTRAKFEIFYTFYNSILNYNEIPLWFPQIQNGLISDNYLITWLSMPDLFVAIIGWLFKIKHSLTLFYLSLTLQVFILTWGAYLFSRYLLNSIYAAVFFTTTILFSVQLMWQIFFNLSTYLYLPLIAYFIHVAISQKDPKSLSISFLCFCISLFGVPPYFIFPLALFALSCLIASCIENNVFSNLHAFMNSLFFNLKKHIFFNVSIILISITLLSCLFSILQNVNQNLQLISPGRSVDGTVNLQQFLAYGYSTSIKKFFEFLLAIPSNPDATFFIGLCPLILFIFSLIVVRRPYLIISVVMIIILISFTFADGTSIPAIFYHFFPFAKFYRHIGLLIPAIHFYLLICAAMGLDFLINSIGIKKHYRPFKLFNNLVITTILVVSIILIKFTKKLPYDFVWFNSIMSPDQISWMSLFCILGLFIVIKRFYFTGIAKINASTFAKVCIIISLFELSNYTFFSNNRLFFFPISNLQKIIQPRLLDNNLWRERNYSDDLLPIITELDLSPGAKYSTRDLFEGTLLCFNKGRNDLISDAFFQLMKNDKSPPKKSAISVNEFWNKARITNIGDRIVPTISFSEQYELKSLLGCTSLNIFRFTTIHDFKHVKNYFISKKKNSYLTFAYDNPVRIQGIQMKKLSFDGEGIYFYASDDQLHWKKIYFYKNEGGTLKNIFISFWFEQPYSYKYYKIQFNGANSFDTKFQYIKLRHEQPMGFIYNKPKFVSSYKESEFIFTKNNSLFYPNPIITHDDQNIKDYSASSIRNNSVLWQSKIPLKFPQFLKFEFSTPQLIKSLNILPDSFVFRTPANFVFWGSNDQKSWSELLYIKKSDIPPAQNVWLKYPILNPKAYLFYKMQINNNYGAPDYIAIQSIKMEIKKKGNNNSPVILVDSNNLMPKKMATQIAYPNSVVFTKHTYNQAKLKVFSNGGWLIWRAPYSKYWSIKIDGKPQTYYRADIAFIGIPIPFGNHDVEIYFKGNSDFKVKYSIIIVLNIVSFFLILFSIFRI